MSIPFRVLITGITGMDGSILAEKVLKWENTEVHGLVRRTSSANMSRLESIKNKIKFHDGDITDANSVSSIMKEVQPNYIFNLAAQSHVGSSFSTPEYTLKATGIGAVNVMQAMKQFCPEARMYQASSSEMFGHTMVERQDEKTPLVPISPYAVAKTMAHHMANIFRQDGLFITCGILFNHESHSRGDNFLTKKVIKAVARREHLELGNLSAIRDWGYAPEYVDAMIKMMELSFPIDLVIGTGKGNEVREFVARAYSFEGLDWKDYVTIKTDLYRPIEAGPLIADSSLAEKVIRWKPTVTFNELIKIMLNEEKFEIRKDHSVNNIG